MFSEPTNNLSDILDETVDNLGASATYTGSWVEVSPYGAIVVTARADQPLDVVIEQSQDGITVDADSDTVSVPANTPTGIKEVRVAQYARIKATNTGAGATTSIRVSMRGSPM